MVEAKSAVALHFTSSALLTELECTQAAHGLCNIRRYVHQNMAHYYLVAVLITMSDNHLL